MWPWCVEKLCQCRAFVSQAVVVFKRRDSGAQKNYPLAMKRKPWWLMCKIRHLTSPLPLRTEMTTTICFQLLDTQAQTCHIMLYTSICTVFSSSSRCSGFNRVVITSIKCNMVFIRCCSISVTVPLSKLSPPPADRVWLSQSFNVGTAGAKIFTGPAAEEFGYTVLQTSNHQGKWWEFKSSLFSSVQWKDSVCFVF